MTKPSSIYRRLCYLGYALVVAALAGCVPPSTKTPTSLTPVRVLSARAHIDEAWRLARQWRADAKLIEIQASIIGPYNVDLFHVDFDFESPSEEQLKFSVICSSSQCFGKEFSVPVTTGFRAIEFTEDMIDSVDAARIGQENGGERFVRMKARDVTMSVRLGADRPRDVGPTVWVAKYYGTFGSGLEYAVVIDPYTGKVIRTENYRNGIPTPSYP